MFNNSIKNCQLSAINQLQKILTIGIFLHRKSRLAQLLWRNPSVVQGDFLQTGDFQPLALLDDLDEGAGLAQTVVRAGVEPRKTALQLPNFQFATLQIFLIDGRDFQFATRTRLDVLGDFHHAVRRRFQPRRSARGRSRNSRKPTLFRAVRHRRRSGGAVR